MEESIPEAPPPGLARQMASDIRGIRVETDGISAAAKSVGHLHPATAEKMTEILQRLIVIGSYLRGIETTISAKKQAGELQREPRQTPHDELELVAASMSAGTKARMMQSLHRVGDHSLDDSEEGPRE